MKIESSSESTPKYPTLVKVAAVVATAAALAACQQQQQQQSMTPPGAPLPPQVTGGVK
ncbi:MAG: hypothetical protein IKZ07_04500 [Akkermansia sp.]|nr:hypothetical protein [Akkermansia sp.]